MMKVNQSNAERIVRVLTGLTILKKSNSLKMKAVGLVPLVTGATGYCPAKSKLGLGASQACCHKHKADKTEEQATKTAKTDDAKTAEKMDEATPA